MSTNDPERQEQEKSGGITVDNSSAEMHTTIHSIAEAPGEDGVLWVGTDDGNVQLTCDGGSSWTNVARNLKGVPARSGVSFVHASNHANGRVFVALDRHMEGDMQPYLQRSDDYGKSFTPLLSNKAPKGVRGYVHVVKDDPVAANVLYVGTEFGLFVSIDSGATFAEYKGSNFPSVAVRDLVIHPRDHDLVLATHGRGIWIMDDLTPLRALTPEIMRNKVSFLPTRPIQQRISSFGGGTGGDNKFTGANPEGGAWIQYYQPARHLFGKLKIEILDADGKVIDTLPASKRRGINRVTWSMRLPPPRVPKAAQAAFEASQGPRVVPGQYTVRLTKDGEVYDTTLDVSLDRRADYSVADKQAQFAAVMRLHGLFGRMSALTDQMGMINMLAGRMGAGLPEGDKLKALLSDAAKRSEAIRKDVVATKEGGAITGEERLREQVAQLYGAVNFYEGRPGDYHVARIAVLEGELADVEGRFKALMSEAMPAINAEMKARGMPPLPGAPPATSSTLSSHDSALIGAALQRLF